MDEAKMILRNKTVIVTGGAGFIGSHLTDRLLGLGNHVIIIDDLRTGRKENINHEAEFIEGDLTDREFCLKHIKNADIVFHLAANADIQLGTKYPNIDFDENVVGTDNVLEAMRINEVDSIVFTSSSVVYGEAKKIPTPEDYGPLVPISMYGASKLSDEALICGYCGSFGIRSWIFRFANIIGPRESHGIIFDLINKLRANHEELEVLGDGSQTKSYVHVSDCVNAMIVAVEKADEPVNIYNISSDNDILVKDIVRIVVDEMGMSPEIKYTGGERGWVGDVRHMLLDSAKLRKLGWKPVLDSKKSVQKTAIELINEMRI
jgi:UDP-glucose 4-epimerase